MKFSPEQFSKTRLLRRTRNRWNEQRGLNIPFALERDPSPGFVKAQIDAFVECGIFAHEFLQLRRP